MREEEHWTVRRQKLAKCKTHGLHYDPRMTSGCALCRKEGLAATPRKKPQMVLMLLAILGATVIAYRIFTPGALRLDTVEAAEAAPGLVAPQLRGVDPKRYREAIEAVDTAFLGTPGVTLSAITADIDRAVLGLGRELAQASDAEARRAGQAIAALAGRLEGIDAAAVRGLRDEWYRTRNQSFRKAPWFVLGSGADPRTDLIARAAYRQVADELGTVLGEGTLLAESLAEPLPLGWGREDEAARRQQEWAAFQAGWQQRIADLRAQLPPRPGADADPLILVAAQEVEKAVASAASLAADGRLPDRVREGGRARLADAVAQVDRMRSAISAMP